MKYIKYISVVIEGIFDAIELKRVRVFNLLIMIGFTI